MHARTILLALVMLSAPLVGCIGDEDSDTSAAEGSEEAIDPASVEVPEGAEMSELEDGVSLVWQDPSLPLNTSLEIPEGATIVNASVQIDEDARAWTNLTNAATGLPRCQPTMGQDILTDPTGPVSCAAMTAPDELPATWDLSVEASASSADWIQVDYRSVPLDGLAGQLSLEALSAPVHDLAPVQTQMVEGAGGTGLHVELHTPDAEGPFPAVLVSRLAANASADAAVGDVSPVPTDALAHELTARGYAVAVADVRGTGSSGGCLDVWGPTEQADQGILVEWLSEQDVTTDQLAAVGFGYSATTALEAAIAAPDKVDAVVSLGGVTDAYHDWHFGGVPNGEGVGDVFGGQVRGALGYADAQDRLTRVTGSGSGGCDGAQYGEAMDPRAVYNSFYEARNLTQQTQDIQAPLLHAQGLFDQATKPSMAQGLVGETGGEQLSMIGPWAHQLPARADTVTMIVAWLDQHVKQVDVGLDAALEASADASITTASGLARSAPVWPPSQPELTTLYPDFDAGQLASEPVDGSADVVLDPVGASTQASTGGNETLVELSGTLDEQVNVSGAPSVQLQVELQGMENAFVAAYLDAKLPDGTERVVSFGMANLAHRAGHDVYEPVPPGEAVGMALPMQPTEMVLPAGTEIELTIRSATTTDWSLVQPGRTGQLTLLGGAQGTAMALPTSPPGDLGPAPTSVQPPAAVPAP